MPGGVQKRQAIAQTIGKNFEERLMNNLKRILTVCCLIAAAALWSPPVASARNDSDQDITTIFIKANEAYNTGEFQQAAELYETALREIQNGYLYYNLGNCYFKMDKIGQALLNYRRAQKLIPRFEDLISNLKYARQETKDKIESKGYSQVLKKIFFWYYLFNKKELIAAFLTLNFVFFLLAGIRIYFKTDTVKWILLLVSIIYLILGASGFARIYQEHYGREGVITAEEVPVRSGNGVNNVILFKLHEGTEFLIDDMKGDWLKIKLSDGKKGWIQNTGAGII
jgi:tetratricopeptide (TPR) repeat protein